MRNLLMVCAGLVVCLGVVSANLWFKLQADQQVIAELRAQQAPTDVSDPAPAHVLQPRFEMRQTPVAAVQNPEPVPVPPAAQPTPVPAPAPAPANRVAIMAAQDAIHAEVMAQSEQTATGRVLQWRDRLSIAGQTLTPDQLQALNKAAITELRREAEQTLAMGSNPGPMDSVAVAQKREETINRQNDTNLRILKAASPQLTPEQSAALRTMFEAGHAQRLAAARPDRERNANLGN